MRNVKNPHHKIGSPGSGKTGTLPQLKGQNIIGKNVVLKDSLPRGGKKNPLAKQMPGTGPVRKPGAMMDSIDLDG